MKTGHVKDAFFDRIHRESERDVTGSRIEFE
jgi:hypothetical protein